MTRQYHWASGTEKTFIAKAQQPRGEQREKCIWYKAGMGRANSLCRWLLQGLLPLATLRFLAANFCPNSSPTLCMAATLLNFFLLQPPFVPVLSPFKILLEFCCCLFFERQSDRETRRNTEREQGLPSTDLLRKRPQEPGLNQDKAWAQDLRPDVPHGGQGTMPFDLFLWPSQALDIERYLLEILFFKCLVL